MKKIWKALLIFGILFWTILIGIIIYDKVMDEMEEPTPSQPNEQMVKTDESNSVERPTREYFENVNKDYQLEQMVQEIGPGGISGSGILYFSWKLEDGSTAYVVFSSYGIERVSIDSEDGSELIYNRRAEE